MFSRLSFTVFVLGDYGRDGFTGFWTINFNLVCRKRYSAHFPFLLCGFDLIGVDHYSRAGKGLKLF